MRNIRRKLEFAVRQIHRNISAYSPDDLEEMVRYRLIEARVVPAELRIDFVRHKIGLRESRPTSCTP